MIICGYRTIYVHLTRVLDSVFLLLLKQLIYLEFPTRFKSVKMNFFSEVICLKGHCVVLEEKFILRIYMFTLLMR